MLKGIILAGGTGSRLKPFTEVTNKHLALVYDRPMIFYPLLALRDAGVKDVLIIVGGNSIGDFLKLLKSGTNWGMNFTFKVQDAADGIAGALSLAKGFITSKDRMIVVLGDNIYSHGIKVPVNDYRKIKDPTKAAVILRPVSNPKEYGVATLRGTQILKIVEKPEEPESDMAVTGCYMFPYSVFEKIEKLSPSKRGELEISDINQMFADELNLLSHVYGNDRDYPSGAEWYDAGTIAGILKASNAMERLKNKGSIY